MHIGRAAIETDATNAGQGTGELHQCLLANTRNADICSLAIHMLGVLCPTHPPIVGLGSIAGRDDDFLAIVLLNRCKQFHKVWLEAAKLNLAMGHQKPRFATADRFGVQPVGIGHHGSLGHAVMRTGRHGDTIATGGLTSRQNECENGKKPRFETQHLYYLITDTECPHRHGAAKVGGHGCAQGLLPRNAMKVHERRPKTVRLQGRSGSVAANKKLECKPLKGVHRCARTVLPRVVPSDLFGLAKKDAVTTGCFYRTPKAIMRAASRMLVTKA